MKHYQSIIISFLAVIILGTPWLITRYPKSTEVIDGIFSYVNSHFSAAFFTQGMTALELKEKYNESTKKRKEKIRIMIVPGHEPNFGGAEYRDLKEREMTVELSEELQSFFENNSHYEVFVARDEKDWNPVLKTYFNQNWNEIKEFYEQSKIEMLKLVNRGKISTYSNGIYHNNAPADVALRLYGINKWNNENDIDLAIHIHFNDYPRSNSKTPGKYSGISIYIPEKQFSNSTTTNLIADEIFQRLSKYNATSDLPIESNGVIEEQELIAIGSYNTSDIPSMLIEYGYIYEPQFTNEETRKLVIKDLAYSTYLGVEDFFENSKKGSIGFDNPIFPYEWNKNMTRDKADEKDIVALQTVLIAENMYPPEGKTKNDCPRTGTFGTCTIKAITEFQDKYSIEGESGYVGEKTRSVLNNLYSITPR